jgi:hypothetical protein
VLLAAALLTVGHSAAEGGSLFAGDEVFDLTVVAPFATLMRQSADAPDVAGRLELADGATIPMTCSKYGISRLRECDMAPLRITIEASEVDGTVFEGRTTLRLVTPCRLRGGYDEFTVLEYLVYRSYAVIADPALEVRLARVRFEESQKPEKVETGYAFFIEDIGRAAARRDQAWLDIESQGLADLDPAQLSLMTLFQYMVGNTDWSAVRGRPDDRCCHNVAVFGTENGGHNTVVPFDFDQAGLVDAPYAAPDPGLGIRRVTDRVFRGLCEHNSGLSASIAVFNRKRSELDSLFNDDRLPYPDARKRALKYIDEFYETINNPRKLEKRILKSCR